MSDMGPSSSLVLGDLNVLSEAVRSCDIVLGSDRLSLLGKVEWNSQIRGAMIERLPATSISVVAKEDRSIAGEVASFRLSDEERSEISLVKSQCFDSNGAPLEGELVSLELND